MIKNQLQEHSGPAYKQPWFWFLMAPLFLVFIMGFTMLYLAIVSNDGVIVDNFYKDGLAINTRKQQDDRALSLGLQAELRIDQKLVNLVLGSNQTIEHTDLVLHFVHPTQQTQDTKIELQRSGNGYTGALPNIISGRYFIMLSPALPAFDERMWRLHAEANLPLERQLMLTPK